MEGNLSSLAESKFSNLNNSMNSLCLFPGTQAAELAQFLLSSLAAHTRQINLKVNALNTSLLMRVWLTRLAAYDVL